MEFSLLWVLYRIQIRAWVSARVMVKVKIRVMIVVMIRVRIRVRVKVKGLVEICAQS